MSSSFVVVSSGHKNPKYFVARKQIGKDRFSIICSAHSEFNADEIAAAMSKADLARAIEQKIVNIKFNRKRA